MKIQKVSLLLLMAGFCLGALAATARAAAPAALVLTLVSGDVVTARVSGDPNSTIQLGFYPPGSTFPTSMPFSTTDANGNYSITISSGAYSIPAGVQAYVVINNQQSSTANWPSYASTLSLSQTSASLSVNESLTINASNAPIISFNSNQAALGATVSGNTLTLTGKAAGTGNLTVCAGTAGCGTISFQVGTQTQAAITFSQNNVSLKSGQTANIAINYANSRNGFTISANSNPNAVTPSISGESSTLTLYGESTGSSTITICSRNDTAVCASLYVSTTTDAATTSEIKFSQDTVFLNYGQSVSITASGDAGDNYFVSSNSNPTVVSVGISKNNISFIGSNTSGTGQISICSLAKSGICGTVYVTVATNSSGTPVSFTQTDIKLNNGQNVNVSVYGGIGSNYFIYSISNPDIANVAISNNTISITAKPTLGTTRINTCSATPGPTCADLLVTTTDIPVVLATPITLSQTNLSLKPGQVKTVAISGGSAAKTYAIDSNTNPTVVIASVSGKTVTLVGGKDDGTSVVKICDAAASTTCASLYITTVAYTSPLTLSRNNITMKAGESLKIVGYYSAGGGLQEAYNSKPEVLTVSISNSAITLTGGPKTGSVVVAICSAAVSSDCAHLNVLVIEPPAVTPNSPATTATPSASTVTPPTPKPTTLPAVAGATVSYKFTRQLTVGSKGADATELQKRLTAEKVYSGPITGFFGVQTLAAVKLYQKNHKLEQVGIVGPATRALLNK
ncbi:MAG: hypothetical protein A3H70_04225 [Candidatus Komeilibacteria bacterium RIFCSPLOWO2_02_FULL_48_11]|uniref:Peptidoglycan binding-like domain-containing protein n=1 Tax=Candidatus Komeilibacteria bacterium RIFCSPLOWO2_02_FULL_48_11 TaxID=1798553 RepID=A0A1G2BWS6_9BACT|nr:MAG: hypothetical protein A3H70_04225 [Candidatus Komeilibacteria bacterium RIFCSPLOWO2_02_FULL_48_11]